MGAKKQYWLVKTEPESFSIDDLEASPERTTFWSGVRNYQARNYMRDQMQLGDRVLFYHSNADPPAIVGVAEVVRTGYPDHTAWDKQDSHYDPDSPEDKPRWFMVDLKFMQKFVHPLALPDLRGVAALKDMELLRKGSRLSVQPVSKQEYEAVLKLAK
jgi:predicted RNA-binding protein with PUA-like domain